MLERILDAPDDLVAALTEKLRKLQSDRNALRMRIEQAAKVNPTADRDPLEMAERAKALIDTLSDRIDEIPADKLNTLLRETIERVDCHFEHADDRRPRDSFKRAVVHLRPRFVTNLCGRPWPTILQSLEEVDPTGDRTRAETSSNRSAGARDDVRRCSFGGIAEGKGSNLLRVPRAERVDDSSGELAGGSQQTMPTQG